jgi:hypothetical protein
MQKRIPGSLNIIGWFQYTLELFVDSGSGSNENP